MDDRVLALCELKNDLLFHKIPKEELSAYVDGSLAAGREAAARFAGRDVEDLYRENGIGLRYADSGKRSYGVMLRGQVTMGARECGVEVYRESIEELSRNSAWEGRSLTYDEALRLHLAHEFFHFWEYKNGASISQRMGGVVTFSLLGLRRTAKINRCEEVAAHAFAKELLGLPCLPNLYDYLYLINTGRMTRAAFDGLVSEMGALLLSSGAAEPSL